MTPAWLLCIACVRQTSAISADETIDFAFLFVRGAH